MASYEDGAPPGFGNVQFSDNSNMKVKGQDNTGRVFCNSNTNVFISKSVINLENNSNGKINSTENLKIDIVNCSNFKLSGERNKLKISDNSNFDMSGNDNKWEMTNCANMKVKSIKSMLKLLGNSNAFVDVVNGNVFAENNFNLQVTGESSKVTVKNTQNHELQPSMITSDNGMVNQVQLTMLTDGAGMNVTSAGWLSSWLSSRYFSSSSSNNPNPANKVKVNIHYNDEAQITGNNYKLGAFAFTLSPKSETCFEAELKKSELSDPESLMIKVEGHGQVTLFANESGEKEALRFKSANVRQVDGNSVVFHLDARASLPSNF